MAMEVVKEVGHWAFREGFFFTNKHLVISVLRGFGNGMNQPLLLQKRCRDKHSER